MGAASPHQAVRAFLRDQKRRPAPHVHKLPKHFVNRFRATAMAAAGFSPPQTDPQETVLLARTECFQGLFHPCLISDARSSGGAFWFDCSYEGNRTIHFETD